MGDSSPARIGAIHSRDRMLRHLMTALPVIPNDCATEASYPRGFAGIQKRVFLCQTGHESDDNDRHHGRQKVLLTITNVQVMRRANPDLLPSFSQPSSGMAERGADNVVEMQSQHSSLPRIKFSKAWVQYIPVQICATYSFEDEYRGVPLNTIIDGMSQCEPVQPNNIADQLIVAQQYAFIYEGGARACASHTLSQDRVGKKEIKADG
ncbi:hypothetical protein BGY98DRAFT_1175700 [Russula aff. rugulosa BPL654]|nr:hypothetical protein BGY98DRAFT_1175700 [Russula aff. rugulosa BPL654]